ncbi:MAG TPA: bifunctional serine/threonine-protein kinase/formylglycine-generating enzyme family protein [Bryobacteraceae bacterium]|nr:bifunctional serine/threonine-protein kinase/formylglycine-generating enzyme family protein [Bryobacteraceae bacterium]
MELPARIGKYELEEFLGGGMSHVYRARDTLIGRTVAVKILTEAGCQDPEAKARFLAEARMAGNITHDNVLSIYDFGEDEKQRPFMVMELLKGEDLRHAIKGGRTGDQKSKLKIALQIARALEYIHGQKIIHRDIKPENVHINAAGTVKLMDFGIAKTEGLNMTRAGYVLGTPYYMAPEQVMGQDISDQVDVYSFGILMFELMTGAKPITGDSVERIFYSILNEPLNLEPMRQAGAMPAICDLVARCTAKNPADRPQGFSPVCAEIERCIAELDAPTMVVPTPTHLIAPQPAPPAPSRPAWLLPVIIGLVVVLAVALYFVIGNKAKPVIVMAPELPKTISTPTGEMVLVPDGPFLFGENKETISLPAFYIDKTEVSNKAYAEFCAKTNHARPTDFAADKPDYPVVNVSFTDAQDFATWAGKKLPTGHQWEKAARGTEGWLYPWGNDVDLSKANVRPAPKAPAPPFHPVTDFANGASPFGALNMVGNVWELVDQSRPASAETLANFADKLTPPPTNAEKWYVIRGESAYEPLVDRVIWDSNTVPARWKAANIGFRCVEDPPKDAGAKK